MHLLFHGINKSILDITCEFLKKHGKKTQFLEVMNPKITSIKNQNYNFCKMDSFTETTLSLSSGWIAENHLACSRLITHLLSHVRDLFNHEDDVLIQAFDYVIEAWSCLISRLMTKAEVSTAEINVYVKEFLRFFQNFEDMANVGGGSYLWTRRGNFL